MRKTDPYKDDWQSRPVKDWDRKPSFTTLEGALAEMFLPMGRALRSRLKRIVGNTSHLPAGKTRRAFVKLITELKPIVDSLDAELNGKPEPKCTVPDQIKELTQ